MGKRAKSRIYRRGPKGRQYFWADFRDYADVPVWIRGKQVGGKRLPLVAEGTKSATADPVVARSIAGEYEKILEGARRGRALGITQDRVSLEAFAKEHLLAKQKAGRTTEGWLDRAEFYLDRACQFFGADRELASIGTRDVERWIEHLRTLPGKRGGRLAAGSVLHHLHALSNLFRRARKLDAVPKGHDPVGELMEDKPKIERVEASWLEIHDAALLLEAARTLPPGRAGGRGEVPIYPLLATYLLTGGRSDEVLGLEVSDVSFQRKTVRFHKTPFRTGKGGKTAGADRIVPLWPQLEAILGEYFLSRPPARMLFPSWDGEQERRILDFRGTLNRVAVRAGMPLGSVTPKMFRHTYCSARLQTLDRGEPVSVDTVRRELGHSNDKLVQLTYGHLGEIRHRAEVVEYRIEQHAHALEDRLAILCSTGTPDGTPRGIPDAQESKAAA